MTVEPGDTPTPMSERMQSLLSRAVEDQLSEQRQLATALGDVRGQLARLAQEVEALRSTSHAAPSIEPALGAVSSEVREAVRLLAERVDGVARLVQQRGTDLAEIRAAIAGMEATTRSHSEALGGLSGGLAALPAYGDRIAGLQDNVSGVHERLAVVDEISAAVTAMQQRVEAVDKDLRELRSAFTGIGARMAELPGRGDVEGAVARAVAPLGDVAARLGHVESALSGLGDRLESTGTEKDTDAEHEWLRSELARFAATVVDRGEAMTARLEELDGSVQSLSARLEAALAADEQADVGEPGTGAVLTELGDLREALLGSGGLADRVDALADEDVDARVAAAVTAAVSAAEERLAAHIDEAVLALAQAVLRKRARPPGVRTATTPAPVAAAPGASAGVAQVGAADAEDAEELPDADEAPEADEPEAVDRVDEAPDGSAIPAPAPAATVVPSNGGEDNGGEDASRRRRPWWRPGD